MPFKPGFDPNRNIAGRPRGRIAKFRAKLGEVTREGDELADELAAIWRDREVPVRERLAALELAAAYLVGKPESSINIEADVTGRPGPALDVGRVLASLPDELIDRVVRELDRAEPALLEADDNG